jgi:glycosyltransferase involved in cell wall biosynthesis
VPYASHFRSRGWTVSAASRDLSGVPGIDEAFDGVYDLPLSRSVMSWRGLLQSYRGVAALIADIRPDIVHVHTPIASFVTRLATHRMSTEQPPAVAYTAHGFHFHEQGRRVPNLAFSLAERVAGRWTDRLVVINDEDMRAARRLRLVPDRRLVRMPGIGIDSKLFARSLELEGEGRALRESLGIAEGVPIFAAVAELHRNKRHADIIVALSHLQHREAHVVLAGDGTERQTLETLASRLGVADRCHFVGFVSDVRPLLTIATALVLVSDREGLARSIMEALAMEVPVVASDARGNKELVEPNCGLVVRTRDVGALSSAMDWVVDHPTESRSMGKAGRERIMARYELAGLIDQHERMYAEMLLDQSTADGAA